MLDELRRLNEGLVLISLSRSRTRSVEKQARRKPGRMFIFAARSRHQQGCAWHPQIHCRWRSEDAAREQMRRQTFKAASRFQSLSARVNRCSASDLRAIQQVAGNGDRCTDPRERASFNKELARGPSSPWSLGRTSPIYD